VSVATCPAVLHCDEAGCESLHNGGGPIFSEMIRRARARSDGWQIAHVISGTHQGEDRCPSHRRMSVAH
jgi:hypothetical protein